MKTLITYNFKGIKNLSRTVDSDVLLQVGIKRAGNLYNDFMIKRFYKYSLGGGNWTPLAPSTVRQKGHAAILQERGSLIDKLKLSAKLEQPKVKNIRIAMGIPNDMGHHSGMSLVNLVRAHELGNATLPARLIVPSVPRDIKKKMSAVMNKALKQVVDKNNK